MSSEGEGSGNEACGVKSDWLSKLEQLDKIAIKRGRDSDAGSDDEEAPKRTKEYMETEPVFLGDNYRRIGRGWHIKGEYASFRIAKWVMCSDKWEPDYQKKINLNVKELKCQFASMILEEGDKANKMEKERLTAIEKEEKEEEKRHGKERKNRGVYYKRGFRGISS